MSEYKLDFGTNYKPDILSCLADLSNDEVFTPPEIANKMLDLLPEEIWSDPNIKILDPACKTGVFLREAAKRFIEGEKDIYPDLQERLDHIFHEQLYGIAITELTSLLSRRSVYCSKYPNGPFSITAFANVEGLIRYKSTKHKWNKGSCIFCGTAQSQFDEAVRNGRELHAYEFIHTIDPEELFDMKFDVIISNPPYQLADGGNGSSAKPIYNKFVEQAIKLNPKYLTMIIPSRYFNGGKGLDNFRKDMLNSRHLTHIVDYKNAKECFPGISLGGGVHYFLWERDANTELCEITNVSNGQSTVAFRSLTQFSSYIRFNESVEIIKKVIDKKEANIVNLISSRNPFGISTNDRGVPKKQNGYLKLFSSQGESYISPNKVTQNIDKIDQYKVMISRVTSEHAGEPDKSGMYKVIAKMALLSPGEVCTDSYIIASPTDSKDIAINFISYMNTKFVRFLILQTLSAINLTRECYQFVPMVDFTKRWTDEELYKKYDLSDEEISFIEAMIKPMNSIGGDDNA